MTFGEKLKSLRKDRRMSMQELANKLKVTKVAVHYWEKDENIPSGKMLEKIAGVFGVSMEYLINDDITESMQQEKELEALSNALIKSGLLKNGQNITQEEYDRIIEFIKTNKKFILFQDEPNEK